MIDVADSESPSAGKCRTLSSTTAHPRWVTILRWSPHRVTVASP